MNRVKSNGLRIEVELIKSQSHNGSEIKSSSLRSQVLLRSCWGPVGVLLGSCKDPVGSYSHPTQVLCIDPSYSSFV